MPLAIVFVKVALISVISRNLTPLPIDKKGYPFSSFANKCNRSLMQPCNPFSTLQRNFHLQKSFHKPIFDILNRLDIDKKGSQNQSITVW